VHGDGIATRKDSPGYYLSWVDAWGVRHRKKAKGSSYRSAMRELEAEHLRVEQAKILGYPPPTNDAFKKVADKFIKYQEARLTPREFVRQEAIVNKRLKPFFADSAASIRRVDIQRYITKRSRVVAPGTVRKEFNTLKHLLRLATEWEIIFINPAHGVKTPMVPAGRVRYLQPSELVTLLDHCPDWLRPIVVLAVCTGMRRSEILGLRRLDVDLMNERILLRQTKNGEGRIVQTNRMATSALRTLPTMSGESPLQMLFSRMTPEQVSVAFLRACREAKIADFHFHDLRHTAASWMRMSGADIHTVAQLLGHKDLRMAARYQHLSPAFLAEAVGRLDKVFGFESPAEVPEGKEAERSKALSRLN
jgi:integrase